MVLTHPTHLFRKGNNATRHNISGLTEYTNRQVRTIWYSPDLLFPIVSARVTIMNANFTPPSITSHSTTLGHGVSVKLSVLRKQIFSSFEQFSQSQIWICHIQLQLLQAIWSSFNISLAKFFFYQLDYLLFLFLIHLYWQCISEWWKFLYKVAVIKMFLSVIFSVSFFIKFVFSLINCPESFFSTSSDSLISQLLSSVISHYIPHPLSISHLYIFLSLDSSMWGLSNKNKAGRCLCWFCQVHDNDVGPTGGEERRSSQP